MILSSDINYGIKTGYNTAFIIDSEMRAEIIAQDPKSAEIIKPVLRGRDIQRYQAQWAELWLIDTHNGYGDVPPINIDDYPVIKDHLNGYYERLALRQDKGRTPYNLRNCAYHDEFLKEKLFWMDLTERGRFAYKKEMMFCANTAYMVSGSSLKYLCAVLNSDLITWYMRNSALNSGMGLPRWVRFTVERLPIPILTAEEQNPFIHLVDRILFEMTSGRDAHVTVLEDEINWRVYGLFEAYSERNTIHSRYGYVGWLKVYTQKFILLIDCFSQWNPRVRSPQLTVRTNYRPTQSISFSRQVVSADGLSAFADRMLSTNCTNWRCSETAIVGMEILSTTNLSHWVSPIPVVTAMFLMSQVTRVLFRMAQRYFKECPVKKKAFWLQ